MNNKSSFEDESSVLHGGLGLDAETAREGAVQAKGGMEAMRNEDIARNIARLKEAKRKQEEAKRVEVIASPEMQEFLKTSGNEYRVQGGGFDYDRALPEFQKMQEIAKTLAREEAVLEAKKKAEEAIKTKKDQDFFADAA